MNRILHIAPANYAGVPYDFYRMHNACGDYSRLITLHENPLDFPEDICLRLPQPDFQLAKLWRRKKAASTEINESAAAKYFEPNNIFESLYFRYTDASRTSRIEKAKQEFGLDSFGIIHYDAGLDFFRDARQAKTWKNAGKKIVCCYYGSDLRLRGVIRELDEISDLNITSEYDHLSMKDGLEYVFYPYDPSELPARKPNQSGTVRIIHTPTNRQYKGTDLIISVIDKLKKSEKIEFVLLENQPRAKVLEAKTVSDICIDQVGGSMGGTGYGKAGIETLAMGVPVITNMTEDYTRWLPDNPFCVANNASELTDILITLIRDKALREKLGTQGKEWVSKYHGYESVNNRLYELYRRHNIVD